MTDGSQEFCLRWNNHQATIISVFDYLLENETLVDCTLAAEGQYLKAHKVVLCACSPYLELLLSQHNDKHPILIFKDIKYNELKCMIEYMYKGEVNIAQDQLNHFLKAAESLQIKGLSESEEDAAPQTSIPAPRPPPPRAPPVQRTQPRPISSSVAVESPKRINRNEAASPTRKRRRLPIQGRPSLSGDDASNASESHLDQSNCDVPSNVQPSSDNAIAKLETNSELILEPKTEYDDNSVEDITLDDDEEDYSQAGTSMDNSQMNFSGWQGMDKSGGDEVFTGQDSGAQNSQDINETSLVRVSSPSKLQVKLENADSSSVKAAPENVKVPNVKVPNVKVPATFPLSQAATFGDKVNERCNPVVTVSLNENNQILFESTDGSLNLIDDIQTEAHDPSRHNFTEVNQLLQIDKSLLLEIHPEIDSNLLLANTQLSEMAQSSQKYNLPNCQLVYKSGPLLNRDIIVLDPAGSTDPKNPSSELQVQNNGGQSQLGSVPSSLSMPQNTFTHFLWESDNLNYPIELVSHNNDENHADEMKFTADDLKSTSVLTSSNIIDLNGDEITVRSTETSLSQNTYVHASSNTSILDNAESKSLDSVVLKDNGEISTAPVKPIKAQSNEIAKHRYFRRKFRLHLESKEYLICSYCHEKIGVEMDEVITHCKTCTSINRKSLTQKFRFGCFTCDYKSNQRSHLKRHLSAHLRYVPK